MAECHRESKMGYTHAGHIDALNQNIAELSDNINVSFEFFSAKQRKDGRNAVELCASSKNAQA